jgi:hypothetical protein
VHAVPAGALVPRRVARDLRALEKQVAAWLAASGSGSGGLLGGARASCADLALGLPLHLARLRHRAFWIARPGPAAERPFERPVPKAAAAAGASAAAGEGEDAARRRGG